MAIKLKHDNTYSSYFITFTCFEWLSLIEITDCYDSVYSWFNILKSRYNADVVAYTIMPNHLHLILHFNKIGFNLNQIIGNGKRFIAYEIISMLISTNNKIVLGHLKMQVTVREKNKGQQHKVFKSSFDAKAIYSHRFLLQKINYTHNNAVSGKWMLAKDFVAFKQSSASYYEIGLVRHFKPFHYLDL